MNNTVLGLALLVATTQFAHADTFEPISPEQVPSGMTYSVTQPPVEDPRLFAGKHVAILASHGVEESEITFPYRYLTDRGAQVDILVPEWTPTGVTAVQFLKPTLWVKATGTFKQGMTQSYDLMVLTGGAWNAQVVRTDNDALELIKAHYGAGRPLAAICAGTAVLINAGIAKDHLMTGSPVFATDLANAGAHYVDQSLVISQNLATSRSPNDLPDFVTGLRRLLGK